MLLVPIGHVYSVINRAQDDHAQVKHGQITEVKCGEVIAEEENGDVEDGHQEHQHKQRAAHEVEGTVELLLERNARLPNDGEHFAGRLSTTFHPAELLRLEAAHFGGQFARSGVGFDELDFPALQLGAVAQVKVFGERIGFPPPASSIVARRHIPHRYH